MLDSDDVLLLRPLRPLPAPGDVQLTTCLLSRALTPPEESALLQELPVADAVLVTAGIENRFPRLPVRDEQAVVWLGAGATPATLTQLLLVPPQVTRLEAAP